MLFTGLPRCSSGYRHVLVVEESHEAVVVVLHNQEEKTPDEAKYFLALPETHVLVASILENNNRLLVQIADMRKNYGITFCEFRTISPH